ncbi:GRB10-interacting GYF protein 2 isoform X2 [Boleophthalmus pectinirostris]|uniref:GRB10-interacting GYF protein 2 isoform X2 n=1 Tax=Boleophthalmus pectinirostris TaxID=150288 RepID=UPI00242F0D5F|nr:GRB10-interacting GYF protein 2 isoform X2 [Boleophthalmus pectinirostris]
MAETQTLNFGPEWLRALSGGGGGSSGGGSSNSVSSPPLSPALPKYKLADYRYGREEMLALYIKDNKIPIDLHDKEFLPILQEEPLPPLALVSFTEEEQRNFSMSVNSAAVLRLTGRGSGPIVGAPRGRSTSRGRGRGRGDGGFYQRSFDDVEGFGRGGREMHRSQSWEERADRRFDKPGRKEPDAAPGHFQINHVRGNYEEAGTGIPRKHDFIRSESENWRTSRDDQNGEDDEGGWRLAGSRRDSDRWCPPSPDGPRSAGWREHPDQRRRFPFDARDEERGYRRPRSGSGSLEDERDSLPEWCLEDAEEEAGTFDSSGAFLSLKASKEPIMEEAELDLKPDECEEGLEEDECRLQESKEIETEAKRETDRKELPRVQEEAPPVVSPVATPILEPAVVQSLSQSQPARIDEPERPAERTDRLPPLELPPEPCKVPLQIPISNSLLEPISISHISTAHTEHPVSVHTVHLPQQKPMECPVATNAPLPFSSNIMTPIGRPTTVSHETDEDEGLKHFEQEAEKMVAYLQDGVADDDRLSAKSSEKPKTAGLPLSHEAALKWFYKDPQGEIQGPFNNQEMSEWFQAGYFTMSLLVKRGCDETFQPLGEIMKIWGRVPFTPGPAPPPLPVRADTDQERLKRQQEISALYQLQQLQYQYLLRQQYAQALAQQKAAALSSAPLQQQQQHQQQINLLLQQYQALKIRASESLLPAVTRSLSVTDSGSVWEMQNTSSQATCTPNLQQSAPSTWDGSSVWDLPIDSLAPAPTLEQMQQMQQLEKSKAAKLEMERREAELRAKREEEERKRLEEALRARQEEERKRLEEEELARKKQEEALRRQREEEEALRRQKEEEERLAQEEALRRLEERRREEEERKKREEFLRKQEEERRKQEELETLRRREEEKRAEEEAAAALAQQQLEEQKRREQEAQRQLELQRQRQQQQEALRKLQQQQQQHQLAQMKLPSSSKWGQQTTNSINQNQNTLSLAEIQKLEEERERQAREEQRRQQQELLKLQQQQALLQAAQPQAKLSGWGTVAKQPAATKSLLEIQREEAQQMKQRKEQHQSTVPPPTRAQNRTTALSSSVWGAVNPSSNWGSDSSSIWGDTHNSNMGFWDEAIKEVTQPPAQTRKSNSQKNKGNANLSNSLSGRASKKVEEEEKLLKLFQGVNKSQDTFMQWCEQTLHSLNTANNLDVPTFASFLKEVDSPYEVHDYVRAYLGDTPEAKDFAKQFIERRAKQNMNQRQAPQNQSSKQQQDSVWGSTGSSSLYQSNHMSGQQQRFETVTSGKKKKKQKMVRADPSLLGFSVNASSERLNMGEIETLEDF